MQVTSDRRPVTGRMPSVSVASDLLMTLLFMVIDGQNRQLPSAISLRTILKPSNYGIHQLPFEQFACSQRWSSLPKRGQKRPPAKTDYNGFDLNIGRYIPSSVFYDVMDADQPSQTNRPARRSGSGICANSTLRCPAVPSWTVPPEISFRITP